jgi:hypothetical protein
VNRTPLARRSGFSAVITPARSARLTQAIGFVESNPRSLGHVIVRGRTDPFRGLGVWNLDISETAARVEWATGS